MTDFLYYPFHDGGYDVLEELAKAFGGVDTNTIQSSLTGCILESRPNTTMTYTWSLNGVASGDNLYIVGHGAGGYDAIAGHNDKKTHYKATDIVKSLGKERLPKAALCNVYVYACYSGIATSNEIRPKSLASQVAQQLLNEQYACANNVTGFRQKVARKVKRNNLHIGILLSGFTFDIGSEEARPYVTRVVPTMM